MKPADPLDRLLRSNLKLRQLQMLVALDEFRHLGRAAAFLSLTQPAVSKTLAEVERLFGQVLFTRGTRGTVPTAQGVVVVRFARATLAELERTRASLGELATGAAGRVAVGVMVVATPGLLVPALQQLKMRSPRTVVALEEGDLTRLLPRLRIGELDLVIGRLEPAYAAPDLSTEALFDEPMCLISPADDEQWLADRKRGAPAIWRQLAQRPWVLPPAWASSRVKLLELFHRKGLHPPADVIETASHLMTLTFVRERRAIGFVAAGVAGAARAQGLVQIVPVRLGVELPPVGIFTQRGRALPATAQTLVATLHGVAAGLRPAPSARPNAGRTRQSGSR